MDDGFESVAGLQVIRGVAEDPAGEGGADDFAFGIEDLWSEGVAEPLLDLREFEGAVAVSVGIDDAEGGIAVGDPAADSRLAGPDSADHSDDNHDWQGSGFRVQRLVACGCALGNTKRSFVAGRDRTEFGHEII
jgi:hypothetical protein